MTSPSAHIMLSHWLEAAWGEGGLNLTTIANPEGAAAGRCEITALLAAEQKVLSGWESMWVTCMTAAVHPLCHVDSLLRTYLVRVPWTSLPEEKLR